MNKLFNKVFSFPGSILLVPMLISAVLNTYFRNIIYIGEPVNSLFNGSGTMTLLFMMIFISGLMLDTKQINNLMKEITVMILLRIILVIIIYTLFLRLFDTDGISGICSFTLLIALCSTNPGLFMSLISKYGKKESMSLFGTLNILPLPILPLAIFSLNSGTGINLMAILAIFIPFFAGIAIRFSLPGIVDKVSDITPFLLFFWGIGLGSKINLSTFHNEISTGILLTLMYYIFITLPLYMAEKKVLKSDGLLAISTSSVAALALVIPSLMPLNVDYSIMTSSVNQLTVAFILTSFISPILLKYRKSYLQ